MHRNYGLGIAWRKQPTASLLQALPLMAVIANGFRSWRLSGNEPPRKVQKRIATGRHSRECFLRQRFKAKIQHSVFGRTTDNRILLVLVKIKNVKPNRGREVDVFAGVIDGFNEF
jgi:hypothetical protein